jgi:glycosyltransferase involved in cell wall biosynthesis
MRIAFDSKRAFLNCTGLGNYSRSVISALSASQTANQFILCTPKITSVFPDLNPVSYEVIVPETAFHKTLSSFWRSWLILAQLREKRIDLYHGLSNELPLGLCRSGIRSVVTIHDLIFLRYPAYYNKIDRLIYGAKVKKACNDADRIVAISAQTKDDIVKFLGVNPDKIDVVYQTCHNQFKDQIAENEKESVRKKYGLKSSFVLSVGTIEKRKNLISVINAISEIDGPELVVVGKKTAYFNEVELRIANLGLTKRVTFLHNVDFVDLPAIYQQAAMLVYPSEYEGFGIPIIEGLYSRIPVVTTKGGCFEEAGGDAAAYVKFGDARGLKNTISDILNDASIRIEMIRKGLVHAQSFSNESLVEGLSATYQKTLKH